MTISNATNLPANFCRDVYCEYSFFLDENPYQTPIIPGKHTDPVFEYRFHHTVDPVTENLISYLKNNAICFKVFGFPDHESDLNKSTLNRSNVIEVSKTTKDSSLNSSKEAPKVLKTPDKVVPQPVAKSVVADDLPINRMDEEIHQERKDRLGAASMSVFQRP